MTNKPQLNIDDYFVGGRVVVPNFLLLNPATGNPIQHSAQTEETEIQKEGVPTDNEGFVSSDFRCLSETIVDTWWGPMDYGAVKGVLKNSLQLIPPTLSMFLDHWCSVTNICGHGKNWTYDTSYKPNGINGLLRVDASTNPNIARHVYTGSANRCSFTLTNSIDQSHDMKRNEFWDCLGMEIDGELVRWIVQEIHCYYEISLVWYGADPTAQKHMKEKIDSYTAQLTRQFAGFKNKNEKEVQQMETNFLQEIGQKLGKTITTVEQAVNEIDEIWKSKTQLEEKVTELSGKAKIADTVMGQLKQDVTKFTKIAQGKLSTDLDELEKQVIDRADFDTLTTMRKEKEKAAQQAIPMQCMNCGSTDVERRSSLEETPEPEKDINLTTAQKKPLQKINCM